MLKLLPRLLGVFAIHAVLGALAWGLDRLLLIRQDGLSTELLERIDGDPARAEAYVSDVGGYVLEATAGSVALSAVLVCLWLYMIHRAPPYGDRSARSRRGSWSALLAVAVVGSLGLFWQRLAGASATDLLAPGVPAEATIVGLVAVLLGFWVTSALFAPESTKVAVPGGTLFSR